MQDAADGDHRDIDRPVDQEAPRPFHDAIKATGALAAGAQMLTANVGAQLRPSDAAQPHRLGRNVGQRDKKHALLAATDCNTEPGLGPRQNLDNAASAILVSR